MKDAVVLWAGLCVIGLTGFYIYERIPREGSYIETHCNLSMLQGGNCRFTVASEGSGRSCVDVSIRNSDDEENWDSTTVCSGLVGPKETKNVAYTLDVAKVCGGDFDTCEFSVE